MQQNNPTLKDGQLWVGEDAYVPAVLSDFEVIARALKTCSGKILMMTGSGWSIYDHASDTETTGTDLEGLLTWANTQTTARD